VNPAGTNGTRFLVTTVGLEVPTVEAKAELEEKEVQTRDVLITILAGKTLAELVTPEDKDSLRAEIERRVNSILMSGKLKSVYISKFIIQ
jgi:flagellar FliL protein